MVKIANFVSVLGLGAYSLENLTAWLTQTMDVFQKKTSEKRHAFGHKSGENFMKQQS